MTSANVKVRPSNTIDRGFAFREEYASQCEMTSWVKEMGASIIDLYKENEDDLEIWWQSNGRRHKS